MTGQERDCEEILSRVLHSTTDRVEPVGDGLAKIRVRLTEPWLKRQWWLLRSEFMVLGWFLAVRCESFLGTVRSRYAAAANAGKPGAPAGTGTEPATGAGNAARREWLRWLAPVPGAITAWVASRGPGRGPGNGPRRSPGPVMNWLRPALAVAGAVVLVVAGVFALGQLRQTIVGVSAGASSGPTAPGTSSQTGAGTTDGAHRGRVRGSHTYPTPQGIAAPRRGTTDQPGTHPSPSPCVTPSTSPGGQSPTPTPSATSPSPTTSPTSTTTPTPTASPTASGSSSSPPLSILRALHDQSTGGTRTAALTCGSVPTANPSPSNLAPPA